MITTNLNKYQEIFPAKKINGGVNNEIYRISSNLIAKVRKKQELKNLKEEFRIAEFLFCRGISVPKPKEISKINLGLNEKKFDAFIMEYIPGISGYDLYFNSPVNNKREYFYSKELYEKELRKARLFGFKTKDIGEKNYIWSPEKKKIYLIDFEFWRI